MGSRAEKVEEFCNITGASRQAAERLLMACNDSLEMAINMHMEGVDTSGNDGGDRQAPQQQSSSSSSSSSSSTSSASAPAGGRRSKKSGEEADGGGEFPEEDQVRAPIPQKRETLLEPGYEAYPTARRDAIPHRARIRSVFDGFRNFGNEGQPDPEEVDDSRRRTGGGSANPGSAKDRKRTTLEELFKPPLDIMFKGGWQSARDAATEQNKWLLVNIQDAREFQCQVLNRDVWSSESVKSIVKEHFVFWQQYRENDEAQRFLMFYPVSDWPNIAVLDPRTGERLVTWSLVDSATFCDLVSDFLATNPPLDGGGGGRSSLSSSSAASTEQPPSKRAKTDDEPSQQDSLIDANEDDQLAAAIRASLAESQSRPNGRNGSCLESDSDLETFSGEDSNLSTPVKVRPLPPQTSAAACSSQLVSNPAPKPSEGGSRVEDSGARWHDFLGPEDDEKASIRLWFPDGAKETRRLPSSSQFKAIVHYVAEKGFPYSGYEMVTNFPRRILTNLDHSQTLKEMGLFPQETIYVQQRTAAD